MREYQARDEGSQGREEGLGAELLYVLFLGEAADQEAVFGFGNYVSVKAFHYYGLFGGGVDHAVLAVEQAHVGTYDGVAVFIGL